MEEFEVSIRPEDTGARLRAVRELAGLTTRDVARAAGLSRREIGLVERGKRILDPDELRALAGALGVEPEVLVSQGLGELGPATTEADRIDAVAGHDPDHWHALPVSPADLPPALPVRPSRPRAPQRSRHPPAGRGVVGGAAVRARRRAHPLRASEPGHIR